MKSGRGVSRRTARRGNRQPYRSTSLPSRTATTWPVALGKSTTCSLAEVVRIPQSPTSLPSEKEFRQSRSMSAAAGETLHGSPGRKTARRAVAIDELRRRVLLLFIEHDGQRGGGDAAEDTLAPIAHFDEPRFALRDGTRRAIAAEMPHLIRYDERNETTREQLDGALQEERMRGRPAAALVMGCVIAAKVAGNIDGVAPSEREVRGVADHDIEA